jgi:DNA-binding CsgD family transcriptional regulator/tetratricopeptide (TPR) repeat protein
VVGHRVSRAGFVGRAEELELLGDQLALAAGGRSATVLLGGEAGIGKTRLVEELCERARGDGWLAATGVCVPMDGGGLPYGPVVGVLRDVAQQLGEPASDDLLGPLGSGLGIRAPGREDPMERYSAVPPLTAELAKTRLFESILAAIARLAQRSPAMLMLEDLHWADSGTAELLSFLTRNLTEARVLLVGTYRGEELGRGHELRPWLSELSRHARVTSLQLAGLDRDSTAALIEGLLGHQPDWTLVEAVWARSQGNAYFAEELTAARHSPSLPVELQGVIMTRVEALSPPAQQLLGLAATAGVTTDHQLLVAGARLEPDALDAVLNELIDNQILVVDPNGSGYQFRHALLREAVYSALLPGERRRRHHQVAMALRADESLGSAGPGHGAAELATHWWAAGDWAEALDASTQAADAAGEVWAFPEALAHLERALSATDRLAEADRPSRAERLARLETTSHVAYLTGDGPRSVELALAAIAEADPIAEPAAVARIYALLGRNCWAVGDSQAAFDAYHHAVALLPTDRPSVELARVLAEEARGLMMMSRTQEAMVRCQEAIATAEAVGARAEEGHARNTLGCCQSWLGHHEEGIAQMREALQIAEEVRSPEDLNRAFGNLCGLLADAGRLEEAASLVFDNAAVGEELWGVRLESAAANSADALLRLGRYEEADALLVQVGERGLGACAASPSLARAAIAVRRGNYEEAADQLAISDGLTAALSDVQQRGSFHMLTAELALEQDRPADGYAQIEQALALAAATDDEEYTPEMCSLGVRALADQLHESRAEGTRFDVDKARLLAHGLVEEAQLAAAAPAARGGRCTLRAGALAALCTAERSRLHRSDPEQWAQAASRWTEAGEPYPIAYCRWRQAEALLADRSGRSRAEQSLQEAWRVSTTLGMVSLSARIERLAQRARIALVDIEGTDESPASMVASGLGLTPREVEVLSQLAAGRRDGEIAESLFISKKTVSVHVSNILRKLDCTNRIEAGKIGQAHGLG